MHTALDGFYALFYTGKVSVGFCVVVIKNGLITGADVTGGLYDGTYTLNEEKAVLEATLKLTIPPGVTLVTGTQPSQEYQTQQFPIVLPFDLNQGRPILVQTSTGPVNVIIKKLRDLSI